MAKTKTHVINVYNVSKQVICLQLRAPGGDFYTSEQQVRIMPGKHATLPKSYTREDQITNLCKRGTIRVIYDSEVAEENQLSNSQ